MTGRTHLIVSTGITLSVLSLWGQPVTLPAAAAAVIGSLLPDIDEPNSLLLQKTLPKKLIHIVKILLALLGLGLIVYARLTAFYPPYSYMAGGLMIAACLVNHRLFRQLLMILLGGVLLYAAVTFEAGPWWATIGALLMVCAVLPHRGLTHTIYGAAIWGGLLYFASLMLSVPLWLAGGLSYTLHLLCDVLTKQGIQPFPPFSWKWKIPLMSTGKFSGFLVESICITITFVLMWNAFVKPMGVSAFVILQQLKDRMTGM
ncbi:metal-dependent hydrolase [Paenibacillus rigui]|uniref:Metal-dependent hydrolase n=1 Tax=Paenibacillus rigui TaxID=554312 RepID=A0A229UW59_9BACL|nr:metal-dependent hydrolase [Paenibacillus rigui]OXM87776.1 hypothetical protein CF651_01265 [Paenibacillus rigui]